MIAVLLRCLLMYGAVVLAVRLMGKRQIGELQPAELVITILISELASMPIQDLHLPIVSAILPIFALVALEILISVLALKSVRARSVLYGNPVILIYRGKFRQKAMESARVTIDDILEIMRNDGIADISQIDYAILETNGQLSVIEKNSYRPICADDFQLKLEDSAGLPHLLVMDGRPLWNNLRECGLDEKWLQRRLKEYHYASVSDVFLMTVDENNQVYLVGKE